MNRYDLHLYESECKSESKKFIQLLPYYDGLQILKWVHYCPDCGTYRVGKPLEDEPEESLNPDLTQPK